MRLDAAGRLITELRERIARRSGAIAELESEAAADTGDEGAAERITALQTELGQLAEDHRVRLERELAELEERRTAAAAVVAARVAEATAAAATRTEAEKAVEAARSARRELDTTAEEPAATPPASAPNSPRSTNSFAPTPAHPAEPPPSPTPCRPPPATSSPSPPPSAPAFAPPSRNDLTAGAALLSTAGKDGAAALIVPEPGTPAAAAGRAPRTLVGVACRRRSRPPLPPAPTRRPPPRSRRASSISVGPSAIEAAMPLPQLSTFPGATSFPVREEPVAVAAPAPPPAATAERLSTRVQAAGDDGARRLAAALLDDVWVVESVEGLDPGFRGVAVTKDGRVWSPGTRELRQVSPGGQDRVLSERNRRDALVKDVEQAAQAERAALNAVEAAQARIAEADQVREAKDLEARAAGRARDEAVEAERHVRYLIEQRKAAPAEGASAERKAQLEAAIATERRLIERAERERRERARRLEHEQRRQQRDEALLPTAERFAQALKTLTQAVANQRRGPRGRAQCRSAGRRVTHRRTARVRGRGVPRTRTDARARRGGHARRGPGPARPRPRAGRRNRAHGARHQARLAARAVRRPASRQERDTLTTRIERLQRRREQLGPVNPLAQAEYKEALEHVQELERQREDLETALRELQTLIRDTDRRIKESFEETFTAAAKNFEEVVAQMFPGGRGAPAACARGRRPAPRARRPGGGDAEEPEDEEAPEDNMGVEIEITPAGKSTKRLTLLSGGEKSMTALAFLFAVFLARPCPFYILDEVEAALDDLNIDRFLTVLRSFSDRAQFIVVTHQKRTMEAADSPLRCLDGRQRRLEGHLAQAPEGGMNEASTCRPGVTESLGVAASWGVAGAAGVVGSAASRARPAWSAARASRAAASWSAAPASRSPSASSAARGSSPALGTSAARAASPASVA